MNAGIRIAVADDHALFRRGVVQTLAEANLDVVGEAGTAEEALNLARETLPEIMLLDISMPGESGLDLLPKLKVEVPACKVVMLTVSEDDKTLLAALRNGANGYIIKGITAGELVAAVLAVHKGEAYVSPSIAGRLLTDMAESHSPASLHDLSGRERDILAQIAEGHTNKEIAAALFLSEKTIKHYVTSILTKLRVRNRVEAAIKARSLL